MENITFAIHLDKYQVKKDGTSSLYMRVTLNRKVKLIPLYKYVKQEFFDFSKRRVKNVKGVPNANLLNRFLGEKELLMEEVILDIQNRNKPVSLASIQELFSNNGNKDFVNYAKKELEQELEFNKIKQSSFDLYNSKLNKIAKYQNKIFFNELDEVWLSKYKKAHKEKGNSANTIAGDFALIRKYLIKAKNKGIVKYDPFSNGFEIPKVKTEKSFLTIEELKELLNHYENGTLLKLTVTKNNRVFYVGRKYHETLQHFLISCFTGLRLSDVSSLRRKHINLNDGVIEKNITKSKIGKEKKVIIPLTSHIKKVLDISTNEMVYKSKVRDRFDINVYIREALKILRVGKGKHITFHSSRHTFCITALTLGMPIETVQNIMGHSQITTTLVYSKIVESKRKRDMSVWDKFDSI